MKKACDTVKMYYNREKCHKRETIVILKGTTNMYELLFLLI